MISDVVEGVLVQAESLGFEYWSRKSFQYFFLGLVFDAPFMEQSFRNL